MRAYFQILLNKKIFSLTLDAFGDNKNYTISRFPNENKIQYLTKGNNSIIAGCIDIRL